ncbi:hypothetical protein CsatA_023250 [Cannabis sativa]
MKDFKTKMTCDVIMPLAKENKVKELAIPPKNHPEIDQEDWVKFVASRLTPEHMALRKAQSDRACQNTSRHHSARREKRNQNSRSSPPSCLVKIPQEK